MRVVYLDEAGISANEKTALVGGVIVHPEQHFATAEKAIQTLIDKHVPEERQYGFAFHATELLWGGKKGSVFPRQGTENEDRWQILERLLEIPRGAQIPIAVGFFQKDPPSARPHDDSIFSHGFAYALSVIGVNNYMVHEAPNEWTMLIAEDRVEARRAIKRVHEMVSNKKLGAKVFPPEIRDIFHTPHVKDAVHFAQKSEAMMLQLADAVACIVRREIDEAPNNERFVKALFGDNLPDFSTLRRKAGHREWGWQKTVS